MWSACMIWSRLISSPLSTGAKGPLFLLLIAKWVKLTQQTQYNTVKLIQHSTLQNNTNQYCVIQWSTRQYIKIFFFSCAHCSMGKVSSSSSLHTAIQENFLPLLVCTLQHRKLSSFSSLQYRKTFYPFYFWFVHCSTGELSSFSYLHTAVQENFPPLLIFSRGKLSSSSSLLTATQENFLPLPVCSLQHWKTFFLF